MYMQYLVSMIKSNYPSSTVREENPLMLKISIFVLPAEWKKIEN